MAARETISLRGGVLEINSLGGPARIRIGPAERICDDIFGARVSLRSPMIVARSWVEVLASDAASLAALFETAYDHFSAAWSGRWGSVRKELAVEIRCDGRGHFQLKIGLVRPDPDIPSSAASMTAELETSHLPDVATGIRSLFSHLV